MQTGQNWDWTRSCCMLLKNYGNCKLIIGQHEDLVEPLRKRLVEAQIVLLSSKRGLVGNRGRGIEKGEVEEWNPPPSSLFTSTWVWACGSHKEARLCGPGPETKSLPASLKKTLSCLHQSVGFHSEALTPFPPQQGPDVLFMGWSL